MGCLPITAFLKAGCGFGGSCLPKDVKALIAHGGKTGASMQLLEAVIRVNEQQPIKTVELLRRHAPKLEGCASRFSDSRSSPGPTMYARARPSLSCGNCWRMAHS